MQAPSASLVGLPADMLRFLNNFNDRVYFLFQEQRYSDDGPQNSIDLIGCYPTLPVAVGALLSHQGSRIEEPHIWKDGKWCYRPMGPVEGVTWDNRMRRSYEHHLFIKELQFGFLYDKNPILYAFYNGKLWNYEWKGPDTDSHRLDIYSAGVCALDPLRKHVRVDDRNREDCYCIPIIDPEDAAIKAVATIISTDVKVSGLPELEVFDWKAVDIVVRHESNP